MIPATTQVDGAPAGAIVESARAGRVMFWSAFIAALLATLEGLGATEPGRAIVGVLGLDVLAAFGGTGALLMWALAALRLARATAPDEAAVPGWRRAG